MAADWPWVVEPYDSDRHSAGPFECGSEALDGYIRRYAGQDLRRNLARVFVACLAGEAQVLGYYTVSAASFRKEGLPPAHAKKLPRYPVPAAIMGRLAVDRSCQGQGLGEYLLVDCCHRVLAASQAHAVHALIVDAKDERANAFYLRYGFLAFEDQPMRLFLPMATIERLAGG
jgi:ribosomal protein S18 acetylase RimI-like enzyme